MVLFMFISHIIFLQKSESLEAELKRLRKDIESEKVVIIALYFAIQISVLFFLFGSRFMQLWCFNLTKTLLVIGQSSY